MNGIASDWKCFDWIRVVLVWTAPYSGLDGTVLDLNKWDYKEWTSSLSLRRSKIKLSRLSGKLRIKWQCIIFLVASCQEMTRLACKQALVGRRMNLLAGYEIRVTYQQMQASSFSRSTKDYFMIWPHFLVSRREACVGYIGEKLGNEARKALWLVLT